MFPCGWSAVYGYWWIFPVLCIAMMLVCFLAMRRFGMGCRSGRREAGGHRRGDETHPS